MLPLGYGFPGISVVIVPRAGLCLRYQSRWTDAHDMMVRTLDLSRWERDPHLLLDIRLTAIEGRINIALASGDYL